MRCSSVCFFVRTQRGFEPHAWLLPNERGYPQTYSRVGSNQLGHPTQVVWGRNERLRAVGWETMGELGVIRTTLVLWLPGVPGLGGGRMAESWVGNTGGFLLWLGNGCGWRCELDEVTFAAGFFVPLGQQIVKITAARAVFRPRIETSSLCHEVYETSTTMRWHETWPTICRRARTCTDAQG